jgi:predicted PurR-regulated permease PerM
MVVVPGFLLSLCVSLTMTFSLLAAGDHGTRRLVAFGRTRDAKRRFIKATREIHVEVSRHLRTITLINIVLGAVVGLVLWLLDIPNPELWGTMVAILNFAPYVGAVVSTLVLALVSVMTNTSLADAMLVPLAFIALTSLEGMVITPLVLGQRLSLSPLAVFVSVIVWGWLWGPVGALMAVPLMSGIGVILSHTPGGRPYAALFRH